MSSYARCCVDVLSTQVDRLFYYSVPEAIVPVLKTGMRVRVPFGTGNKPTLAYVMGFSQEAELSPDKIKSITEICEDFPLFTEETLALAEWMREKYYATLISCLKCVQPPGLSANGKPVKPRKEKARKIKDIGETVFSPFTLTAEQQCAVDIILKDRENSRLPALLFGVTGSGKTEVYLRVIESVLNAGKQAVVLVPEIALTPQTVGVFERRFGGLVGVTHSRLTGRERYRLWCQALEGTISIMIGPRSAVFTPFKRLGVIIVDEEHEHSYRSETAPKYDTREVARKRGELTGALVVMGSATPSLESFTQTQPAYGNFRLVTLRERINKMFPEVTVVDMRRELAEGNTSIFGRAFLRAMEETLNAGQQTMLFMNRRGHSTFVSCRSCGYVLACDSCRVNYTWHTADNRLCCHYCGRTERPPALCPACGSKFIRYFGIGTQKVEEEVAKLFPGAAPLRMDMDTTKGKYGHAEILEKFRRGESRVLIGTQMIAKGLDFPNVTLVGVVSADMSLYTGDFRAGEYTFQLLTQVSGRAGRADRSGRVFLQTYNPEHYALRYARGSDYEGFYSQEIKVRQSLNYPPFSHVFMVLFTGTEEKSVIMTLHKLLAVMRYCNKKGHFDMLGPAPAFVSKINKQYRWKILVRCKQEELLKQFVMYCIKKLRDNDPLTGITAHLTLDPVMLE